MQDKRECIDLWSKDTQVLTRNGWTNSVKTGDYVATYDYETEKISFEKVKYKTSRKAKENENLCVCLSNHTLMHIFETTRIAIKENRRDKWKRVAAYDIADRDIRARIPVSGLYDYKGIPLTDDEICFLGLVFSSGEADIENGKLILEAQAETKISEKIEEILKVLKIGYTEITYDGFTKGNRAKRPCKYNVWNCDISKCDKAFLDRIKNYIDFERSGDIENMTKEQFELFMSMSNSETVCGNYSFIKIRHVIPEVAEKLQAMAITRNHKVIIEQGEKNDNEVRVFKENTALINSKSSVMKSNWQIVSAIGKTVWGVETNGGGIVTRYGGRVTILGGSKIMKLEQIGTTLQPFEDDEEEDGEYADEE